MTTTDRPGWDANIEVRNDHLVVLVTRNGEPAGMITLDPEDTRAEAEMMRDAVRAIPITHPNPFSEENADG